MENKKNISVIKTHSFVDLITNSSTELFTCQTKKTLRMVKNVLKKIIAGYNMMVDGHYSMDMFRESFVFSLKEYREWREKDRILEDECRETGNWEKKWESEDRNKYGVIEGWFYDDEDKEDLEYLRKNYIESGDNSGGWWSSDRNPFHERLMNAKDKDGKYSYDAKKAEVDKIYKEVEVEEIKPEWWNVPWKYHHNNTLVKDLDGCVIIVGSGDNSIPYEIWEIINRQLNGHNYHLG